MRSQAARRYGLVLDGSVLTSVITQRGRVVTTTTVTGGTAEEALGAWWDRVRPRGPVTAAVVSDAAQVANVEVASDVPAALVRRHVESKVQSLASDQPTTFAVAARLSENGGPVTVPVAVVPVEIMEGLWRSERTGIRYTVPAMAYTIGGVHLVVAHSASELVLVDSTRREPTDSVVLASGGVAADAAPEARRAHAEAVTEEVDRAIESWRRRGYAIDSDVVHVTGSGVRGDELFESLSLRGYRPRLDRVTDRIDSDAWHSGTAADRVAWLRCALAAAVAVCEPGPLGFLTPPGPRRGVPPSVRATQWIRRLGERSAEARGSRRAAARWAAAASVALVGLAFAAATVPAADGARTLATAVGDHRRAVAVEARLRPDIDLAQRNRWLGSQAARLAGPAWSTVIPAIEAAMPAGMSVQTFDLTDNGRTLAVKVTATATGASVVPDWLARLRRAGVTAETPDVTVDRSGVATFTTSFDVARGFR